MAEDKETNGGGSGGVVGTKRQRRPSVRLGDVGGGDAQYQRYHKNYYSDHQLQRRTAKQDGRTRNPKSSKRTIDVFVDNGTSSSSNSSYKDKSDKNVKKNSDGSGNREIIEETEDEFGDGVAIGSWKIRGLKSKRGRVNAKKARSNWASKLNENHNIKKFSSVHINRSFEPINSEEDKEKEDTDQQEVHDNASPTRDLDDIDNDDDNGDDNVNDHMDGVDVERERNIGRRGVHFLDEIEGPGDSLERGGVRAWLNKLGLGRYAPVFEIHEVDNQVLPLLTLDDLKDMGINAVGSRRKMFCSIQRLNKGFS